MLWINAFLVSSLSNCIIGIHVTKHPLQDYFVIYSPSIINKFLSCINHLNFEAILQCCKVCESLKQTQFTPSTLLLSQSVLVKHYAGPEGTGNFKVNQKVAVTNLWSIPHTSVLQIILQNGRILHCVLTRTRYISIITISGQPVQAGAPIPGANNAYFLGSHTVREKATVFLIGLFQS